MRLHLDSGPRTYEYDEWEERCEDLDEKIEEIEELLDD